MHREGHHGLNALLYAPIAATTAVLLSVELAIIGAFFFVGIASIPDIDRHFDRGMQSNRSRLWTLVPIKHRGFTHTVWFATLCAGLCTPLGAMMSTLAGGTSPQIVGAFAAFCAFGGVIGHIIGDSLTPMGVTPFSPLSRTTYRLGWVRADNWIVNNALLLIGGVVLLAALGYGFSKTGIEIEDHAAMIFQ